MDCRPFERTGDDNGVIVGVFLVVVVMGDVVECAVEMRCDGEDAKVDLWGESFHRTTLNNHITRNECSWQLPHHLPRGCAFLQKTCLYPISCR